MTSRHRHPLNCDCEACEDRFDLAEIAYARGDTDSEGDE